MYRTFIRTWWRENPDWPNGLEPHLGPRHYVGEHATEADARKECREYNAKHPPGRLGKKMEYEEV